MDFAEEGRFAQLRAQTRQRRGIERHDAEQQVVEELAAPREQADEQDQRREDAAGEPEDEGVHDRQQGKHLLAVPGAHLDADQRHAGRCRGAAAQRQRDIAERDDGEQRRVEQPGEADRDDAEDEDHQRRRDHQEHDEDGVDDEGDDALRQYALEQLRLGLGIVDEAAGLSRVSGVAHGMLRAGCGCGFEYSGFGANVARARNGSTACPGARRRSRARSAPQ